MRSRCYLIRPIRMANAYIKEFTSKRNCATAVVRWCECCDCVSEPAHWFEKKKQLLFIFIDKFWALFWFERNSSDCYILDGVERNTQQLNLANGWIADRLKSSNPNEYERYASTMKFIAIKSVFFGNRLVMATDSTILFLPRIESIYRKKLYSKKWKNAPEQR